ncbi:MAG TPA: hypothetical protein VFZ78_00125, partial [Flavisolibacter sp.]
MNKKHLYIAFLVVLLQSCQSVGMMVSGVTRPKVENPSTLLRFAQRACFDTSKIAISTFDAYMQNFGTFGLTEVHVFTADGIYVPLPGKSNTCGPDPAAFLQSLRPLDIS